MPTADVESSKAFEPVIVETEGTVGGKPRIAGTRIRVSDVFLWYRAGKSPEEIAEEYGLGLDQVHSALAYYFSNEEKIQEQLKEREEAVEEARERHDSKL
ncbi:MAG: DUF433 domain-containing protein [Candidatus Nanohalobium sp.]